jgi:hypothetical protein
MGIFRAKYILPNLAEKNKLKKMHEYIINIKNWLAFWAE